MAKIKKITPSGKIEMFCSASWKGIDYLRILPRKRGAEEWSQKQKDHRVCFGAVSKFAKSQMESLIRPIWNKAAHETPSGFNRFLKANKRAFEPVGLITNPERLKLSEGDLMLPSSIKIESADLEDNNLKLELSWKNYEFQKRAKENDSLMLILIKESYLSQPIETSNLRKDSGADLKIENVNDMPDCIYLFFRSHDKEEYSDSHALML